MDFFKKLKSERDLVLTEENDPLSVLCSKSCSADNPNQHNRVWLETHRNGTLVQLCHQCHSNSLQRNYRNDVSKHFASKRKACANAKDIRGGQQQLSSSNSIIWYRYFARYNNSLVYFF